MNLEAPLAALFGWPFVVLALAIYSITRLVTTDSFPPVEKARNWLFQRFPPEGYTTLVRPNEKRVKFMLQGRHYVVTEGHWFGELISCPWCSGMWVATAVFLAFWVAPVVTTFVLVPMAWRVIPGIIHSLVSSH